MTEMQTALTLENEGKIFSILREFCLGKTSYEIENLGYDSYLVNLIGRIYHYCMKSKTQKEGQRNEN